MAVTDTSTSRAKFVSHSVSDHTTLVTEWTGLADSKNTDVLVLVHSALLDQDVWAKFAPRLRAFLKEGWSLISYDLRGHGSAAEAPPKFSIAQFVHDLFDLLDGIAPGKPLHLVGLSLGGAVVQAAALSRPDQVASLVVIGSSPQFNSDIMRKRAELGAGGVSEQVDETLSRWLGPSADSADVEYVTERLSQASPELWSGVWLALADFDVVGRLPSLTMPVLAISGETDIASPPAALERIAQGVQRGKHVMIPEGAHLSPMTQAESVASTVGEFIEANGF